MGVPQLEFEIPKTRFNLLCFAAESSSLLFDLAIQVLVGKEGAKNVRFQLATVQAAPECQGSQAVRERRDRPRQLLERRRAHQATSASCSSALARFETSSRMRPPLSRTRLQYGAFQR